MTVGNISPRVEYTESSATTFAITFPFFDQTDIIVQRIVGVDDGDATTLGLNTDYTITGGDTGNGPDFGTLTLTGAAHPGATLRIERFTKRTQELHYVPGDDFPARSHEDGLDRGTLIDQEQDLYRWTAEQIMDLIGRLLVAGPGIKIVYDDEHNQIIISATSVTDALAQLPDMLELSGDQQTFTGNLGSPGAGSLTVEDVQDIVGAMMRDGTGIHVTYNDGAGTLTIDNTGGGGGGGGTPLGPLLADIDATGIAANEFLVGDGTNSIARKPITTFMQGLMNSADAAAVLATLGALGIIGSSLGSPGYIELANHFKIQWGQTTVAGNTTPTISFPHAFSSYSIPVGSGGHNGVSNPNNCRVVGATTSGFTVCNNDSTDAPFFWIAVGV